MLIISNALDIYLSTCLSQIVYLSRPQLVSACLVLPVCLSTFVCLRTCQVWSPLLIYMVHWWEHWTCRAIRPLIRFVLHPSLLLLPIHLRRLFFLQRPQNWAQICVSILFLSVFLTYQTFWETFIHIILLHFVILYRDISRLTSSMSDATQSKRSMPKAIAMQSRPRHESSYCACLYHTCLCQLVNVQTYILLSDHLTCSSPLGLGARTAWRVQYTVSDSDLWCAVVAWALGRRPHIVRLALQNNPRPLFLLARHSMTQLSPLALDSLYVYFQHVGAAGMRFSLAAHLQLSHDTPAKAEACEKRQRTNRKPPGKREYQAGNRKHQTREGKLQERKTPNRECKPPYASIPCNHFLWLNVPQVPLFSIAFFWCITWKRNQHIPKLWFCNWKTSQRWNVLTILVFQVVLTHTLFTSACR